MKRLSNSELIIMRILWNNARQLTSNEILDQVKDQLDWKLAGIMTALARMAEKGYVYCDRSTRTNYYSPVITEKDYKLEEGRSVLEKLFDNSATGLIASLYQGGDLSSKEIRKLREYLDTLESGEEEHG